MQSRYRPADPLLYGIGGFGYCDLLLAKAERAAWQVTCRDAGEPSDISDPYRMTLQAVSQRAALTLKMATTHGWILHTGLDHLTFGRIALYGAILQTVGDVELQSATEPHYSRGAPTVAIAVDNLRRSGNTDDIPHGLLTRAWLRSLGGIKTGPESAQSDLDEALEIAERGPMPLFLADIHLYRARLFFREEFYPWESPKTDLAEARQLIDKHGYGRRKEELEDAEAAIVTTATPS